MLLTYDNLILKDDKLFLQQGYYSTTTLQITFFLHVLNK